MRLAYGDMTVGEKAAHTRKWRAAYRKARHTDLIKCLRALEAEWVAGFNGPPERQMDTLEALHTVIDALEASK